MIILALVHIVKLFFVAHFVLYNFYNAENMSTAFPPLPASKS
jgi:hypothetical protein